MKRIAILGGGSWGTALAILLAKSSQRHTVSLWVRQETQAARMHSSRVNEIYLPGHPIPHAVLITAAIAQAIAGAEVIIGAVPAAHTRHVFRNAAPHLAENAVLVSATKGLEPASHERMTNVIGQAISPRLQPRLAVLSGPSFAQEVVSGHPTAVVLASHDRALADELQHEFAASTFRLYTNEDVLGVELAGATKNVVAIAAGACQGLGLGANTLAALITRGLAEMTRLAVALGARPETLSGLAGLGDLVLTCTGTLSRNRHVGLELGKGRPLAAILAESTMVAEGVATAPALLALARDAGVDLPITEQVVAILQEGKAAREAIRSIMERPQKRE